MEGKELYFAFASSLSQRKMVERGAKFTNRVGALLRGFRLTFNSNWKDDGFGYANITPDESSLVYGALYTCEEGSMNNLDREHIEEGGKFHRVSVQVETGEGKLVNAMAYRANEEFVKDGLKPSKEYLNELLEGEDIIPREHAAFLRRLKNSL